MKKTIFTLVAMAMFMTSFGQQRIHDLATQAAYNSGYWLMVDYGTWGAHRKMSLGVAVSGITAVSYSYDTAICNGAGLYHGGFAIFGSYLSEPGAHYISGAWSLANADHVLDSALYAVDTASRVWERGIGINSIQETDTAQANGNYSLAANYITVADGANSTALNFSVASGVSSTSSGTRSCAYLNNSRSLASDYGYSTKKYGSEQMIEVVASCATVGATADTMEIGHTYADGMDTLHIPTDCVMSFEVQIVGVQYGGASGSIGDCYTKEYFGTIKNNAGTTAMVGVVDTLLRRCDAAATNWVVTITANDVLEMLAIKCVGEANKNINWIAYIRFTMNGYRNFNLGY